MERCDSAVFERIVPPSGQIHRTWKRQEPALAPEWLLGPVCVSVLLPADPVTSVYLSFQSRNLEILFSHSSASRQELLELLLSGPVTRKNVPLLPEQYYVIPSSVSCSLKEQNPWERNSERNSSL